MEKLEELNYHVDFGPYYVHLTRKQKKYLAVRSVIDRILAVLALVLSFTLVFGGKYCTKSQCTG